MQVGWALSVSTKVAEEKGIHYDAYGYATSKYRRQTSSYQSIQGDETGSGYEVCLNSPAPAVCSALQQGKAAACVLSGCYMLGSQALCTRS